MEEFEFDNENYENISEFLKDIKGNFNILEEQVDIEIQMEYFDMSKSFREKRNLEKLLEDKYLLFDENTDASEKKILLMQLASADNVEAYKIIKEYSQTAETEHLKMWTSIALQECKTMLESKFLDKNQVLISTGLGGKSDKLRYFAVLIMKDDLEFSDFRKKIVKKEIEYVIENNNSELEETAFFENYFTATVLIPIDISIKKIFDEIILECNIYGNFLKENFIITNVKKLELKDIDSIVTNELKDKFEDEE